MANASSSNPNNPSQSASAENSEEVKVLLSSASAGYMEFGGLTSATVSQGDTFGAAAAANKGSTAGYEFTLTTAGDVDVSWTAAGNNSNPNAYTVGVEDLSNNILTEFNVATNSTGSTDINLGAGTWNLFFLDNPGPFAPDLISAIGAGISASGGAKGTFHFVINDAPEPSTWAMMLLGFAGLGYTGYRAKHNAAAVG